MTGRNLREMNLCKCQGHYCTLKKSQHAANLLLLLLPFLLAFPFALSPSLALARTLRVGIGVQGGRRVVAAACSSS